MKLYFLLTVAIVLIGITTVTAFECYYDRMSRIPNYAKITTPKKTLSISRAHGICVAPNGNFAVMSYNRIIHIYYSCGKPMKQVNLRKHGLSVSSDCAFTDHRLYIADYSGAKVIELSVVGKYIRIFATGRYFTRIAACRDRLYVTTNSGGQNVYVYDTNGRLIRRISVPARHARGVLVGTDGNLHVSNWARKQVYVYTPQGKQVSATTYKELQYADGIAMDTAGNILIADYQRGKVEVYSPCGTLIKTIRTGTTYSMDVEIANDGTVLVAAWNKVLMY